MEAKHFLKNHAYQNIPLTYEEAYDLGVYALVGCGGNALAQIQSIALLCALHNRATYLWQWDEKMEKVHGHRLPQTAAEQIAGICAAVFERDIACSEFGFFVPDVDYVIDNCGMGGDLIITANISTIAAFIAAAAGIPMCKHGSPANADEGRYGSSDFISLICGINTFVSKSEIEECISQLNFGYTEALDIRYKHIHQQTHKVAQLPHMNDIIGPITNPVNPRKLRRKIVGINHLIPPKIVAEAYAILNDKGITFLEHGLFVRGYTDGGHYEGIDEISVCEGGTQVAELKNGNIREFHLYASDFGIEPIPAEAVSPVGNKGEYSLRILRGEINGPRLNLVLANAAVLFYVAGRSSDLKECYKMAENVFRSGQAYQTMLAVREMLPKDNVLS